MSNLFIIRTFIGFFQPGDEGSDCFHDGRVNDIVARVEPRKNAIFIEDVSIV